MTHVAARQHPRDNWADSIEAIRDRVERYAANEAKNGRRQVSNFSRAYRDRAILMAEVDRLLGLLSKSKETER